MKKEEKKRTQKPFYNANTVEVKFPDGKVRRVNKFEAKALEEKLKTPKFQAMFGKGGGLKSAGKAASVDTAAIVKQATEAAKEAAAQIVEDAQKAAAQIIADAKKAAEGDKK